MTHDAPDWPPKSSAARLRDGTTRYGSTGQLFEVKNGRWVRVRDKEVREARPTLKNPSGHL